MDRRRGPRFATLSTSLHDAVRKSACESAPWISQVWGIHSTNRRQRIPSRSRRRLKHAEIIGIATRVAGGRIFARFLLLKAVGFSRNATPQTDEPEADMEFGLVQTKQMLIQRLQRQGVENCLIPGLIKQLASVFFSLPHLNRDTVNERLGFLGWNDFKLDEQSFQLVKACFEDETITSPNKLPASWFTVNFTVTECP